mgnify:FL=1
MEKVTHIFSKAGNGYRGVNSTTDGMVAECVKSLYPRGRIRGASGEGRASGKDGRLIKAAEPEPPTLSQKVTYRSREASGL